MRLYCTQFDSQFLSRGIAMIRSLRRFDACAAIQVVALDAGCAEILKDLFGEAVTVVEAEELPELRATRSPWAYYATLKPLGIVRALERATPGSVVAFVDADTWFFSDPSPLFAEFEGSSIGLSPHRYAPGVASEYGEYNAGCILWRADGGALRCAREWLRDCVDWCEEKPDDRGRFMNQGYLTHWPERYSGVHVIRHPGVNLAPWNVDNYNLEMRGLGISVGEQPLVFYHFSGLVPGEDGIWHSFHAHPRHQLEFVRQRLYGPYLEAVEAERAFLQKRYSMEGTGNRRAELKAGPAVLRFRASDRVVLEAEIESERLRTGIRALVDAGMIEAALLAIRAAGPPVRGSRAEWDRYTAHCEQIVGKGHRSRFRRLVAAVLSRASGRDGRTTPPP